MLSHYIFLPHYIACDYEYECGECSATCGEAFKTCRAHIIQKPRHGSNGCPTVGPTQIVPCDLELCSPQGINYASVYVMHHDVCLWQANALRKVD